MRHDDKDFYCIMTVCHRNGYMFETWQLLLEWGIDIQNTVILKSLLLTTIFCCYLQPCIFSLLVPLPGLIILTCIPFYLYWSIWFSFPYIFISSPFIWQALIIVQDSAQAEFYPGNLSWLFLLHPCRLGSAYLSRYQNILGIISITALVIILCVYLSHYSLSVYWIYVWITVAQDQPINERVIWNYCNT